MQVCCYCHCYNRYMIENSFKYQYLSINIIIGKIKSQTLGICTYRYTYTDRCFNKLKYEYEYVVKINA